MTIEEIRKAKQLAELELLAVAERFEKQTGIRIMECRWQTDRSSTPKHFIELELERI